MLITIINRARGEDRGLVACIKQGVMYGGIYNGEK